MNVAVNLLWVRPGKVGGIESYIRNLLDGLLELPENFGLVLFVSLDNGSTFEHYAKDSRVSLVVCNVESSNVAKRIIWENLHLGQKIRKLGISTCFSPTYSKPIMGGHKIKFITTIHDLQAAHYPEYFSQIKVLWMNFSWWNTVRSSTKIVAISEFVKQDILQHFPNAKQKTDVIYNAIQIDDGHVDDFSVIHEHYKVQRGQYFFTVSSLLPHKNLKTLIIAMDQLNRSGNLSGKLIISGIGGKSRDELTEMISRFNLNEKVVLTKFIPDSERNALYKYCRAFLFPSLFEGFGMPPIEAMHFGVPVLTTRKASLEEVTHGLAQYVEDPLNADEWANAIMHLSEVKPQIVDFPEYKSEAVAKQYLQKFEEVEQSTVYR